MLNQRINFTCLKQVAIFLIEIVTDKRIYRALLFFKRAQYAGIAAAHGVNGIRVRMAPQKRRY